MSYDLLSLDLQNLINFQFIQSYKFMWFFIFFATSVLYIFYFKERLKPTPFFSVGLVRLIISCLAYPFLIATPFLLLFMSPTLAWDIPFMFYMTVYMIPLTIFSIVVVIDMFYFGTMGVFVRLAGWDLKNRRIKEAMRRILPKRKW